MEILNLMWGNATSRTVTITTDGVPYNLTGKTVRFTIKKSADLSNVDDSDALILKDISTHSNPSAGETTLILTANDMKSINEGVYYADFRILEDNKNTEMLKVIVSKVVTKGV